MYHLYVSVLLIEILTVLWSLYRYYLFTRVYENTKMDNYININSTVKSPKIILVIPCLREQMVIEDTLNHIVSLQSQDIDMRIVVVTTEKEEHQKLEMKKNKCTYRRYTK